MDKTCRGFGIFKFKDDYSIDCSLQESSACEPHIWLGVHAPVVKIMWKDAVEAGLTLKKDCPETNEYGWCTIPMPQTALINGRMHLNQKQAEILAKQLLYFARHGHLNPKADKLWEDSNRESV